jgi:hypothetical protein
VKHTGAIHDASIFARDGAGIYGREDLHPLSSMKDIFLYAQDMWNSIRFEKGLQKKPEGWRWRSAGPLIRMSGPSPFNPK